MTTTETTREQSIEALPLLKLTTSKTLNPRRTEPKESHDELVESIKRDGILQSIVVRRSGHVFEVIAGNRRVAAARDAGLQTIPARIVDVDDDEARRLAIVENVQREDLPPVEEATAFELLERSGLPVLEIAARVGKSESYVRRRMVLAQLPAPAKKALAAGEMSVAVAEQIGRVANAGERERIWKELAPNGQGYARNEGHLTNVRHVREIIGRDFLLKLGDAPFDPKDANLVPAAGACGPCPKRTGGQPSLFGDVKDQDLCTDAKCYRGKCDAAWAILSAAAKARGESVLDDGRKVFEKGYNRRHLSHNWIDVEAEDYRDGKKWRKKLKGKEAEFRLVRNPDTGGIHRVVPRETAERLTRPPRGESSTKDNSYAKAERARRAAQLLEKAALEAGLQKIHEHYQAVGKGLANATSNLELLRACASGTVNEFRERADHRAALRRGMSATVKPNNYNAPSAFLTKWLADKDRTHADLLGLIAEQLVGYVPGYGDRRKTNFVAGLKAIGVNHAKLLAAAAVAKPKTKKTAKPKAKAK